MAPCPECKTDTQGRRFCIQCGKPQLRPEDINPDGADRALFQLDTHPHYCFSALTCSGRLLGRLVDARNAHRWRVQMRSL